MERPEFDDSLYLDFDVALTKEPGNRAYFGRNVLDHLIEGIDDFVHEHQPRWERRTYRVGAPVMLGCSPWANDDKLLDTITSLLGVCVLVGKQRRNPRGDKEAQRLQEINERTPGIEMRALTGLSDMAPKVDGQPRIIGPYDHVHEEGASIPTFRTIGFRPRRSRERPPLVHAKLALLGNVCWTDEDPMGGVDDYVWFSPRRLWVSSANFTYGSRQNLEFGYWTEDEDLIRGVERFLVGLIAASEDVNSPSDHIDPELVQVDFDDEAMADALAAQEQAYDDWDESDGEDPDDVERP